MPVPVLGLPATQHHPASSVLSSCLHRSDIMGNSRSSLQLQPEEIEAITEETGFTQQQIERLYARFSSLDKQSHGYLTREDFLRIPELAINPLGDRIVHAFFYESRNTDEEKVDFKVAQSSVYLGSYYQPCYNFRTLSVWLPTSGLSRRTH